MDTLAELLVSDSPWLLVLAGVLLLAALFLARQLWASVRRLGARVGETERLVESERTRRRQLEAVLYDDGLPLPYWPPDGPQQQSRPRRSPEPYSAPVPLPYDDQADDEDGDDLTRERSRIPVPPLSESERQRLARHRR